MKTAARLTGLLAAAALTLTACDQDTADPGAKEPWGSPRRSPRP